MTCSSYQRVCYKYNKVVLWNTVKWLRGFHNKTHHIPGILMLICSSFEKAKKSNIIYPSISEPADVLIIIRYCTVQMAMTGAEKTVVATYLVVVGFGRRTKTH